MDKEELSKLHKRDAVKATAQEAKCIKQFMAYMETMPDYTLVDKWRTIRSGMRVWSKKQNKYIWISHNNDLFGKEDELGFDLVFVYEYKGQNKIMFLIQCIKNWDGTFYNKMHAKWYNLINAHCYLAIYGLKKRPSIVPVPLESIKLKDFLLLKL
jgi:hypothetical protein